MTILGSAFDVVFDVVFFYICRKKRIAEQKARKDKKKTEKKSTKTKKSDVDDKKSPDEESATATKNSGTVKALGLENPRDLNLSHLG